jgi:3-oxoacyl-[acyl-carrier protein] reductase
VQMSFEGKTIVITGASGGIGGETARLFARGGANIIVNYLTREEEAERTVEGCRKASGDAFAFRADVSNPNEVKALMDAAVEMYGRIDVLINCAAAHPPPVFDFSNPDWEHWKRMAHVNVMGVIACSHHAAPHLRETRGSVVNVVMDWDAGGIGYTATKALGTPLTRGLARELAPIRVNAVSPGAVDSWGMTEDEKSYWIERTLLRRVGRPIDVARAIVFLASDEASWITGATLQVDGGTRLLV